MSIGGEKGVQFDAIVTGAPGSHPCPGGSDLGLFHLSGRGTTGVNKGEKDRVIVLEEVKGQTVPVFVEAPVSGFEEFLPKAQKVIKTVEWEGA